MPSATRKAIIESFLKLLNEYPLNRITVKMIVEECGVNRNSFYYHFEDLPALVDAVLKDEADKILQREAALYSLKDCLTTAIQFALKNKKAALHLFKSESKELYLQHLSDIAEYVASSYINALAKDIPVKESDKAVIIQHYKCMLIGYISEWMKSGMRFDILEQISKICELFEGQTRRAFLKSTGQK